MNSHEHLPPYAILTTIQHECVRILKEQDWFFGDIPIIAEDVGEDIDTVISDRVAAKVAEIGIVGVVTPVSGSGANPNLPGVSYSDISVVISWIENVVVNRGDTGTKKFCGWAAVLTNFYLNNAKLTALGDGNGTAPSIHVEKDRPFRRFEQTDPIIFECYHRTHGGIQMTT